MGGEAVGKKKRPRKERAIRDLNRFLGNDDGFIFRVLGEAEKRIIVAEKDYDDGRWIFYIDQDGPRCAFEPSGSTEWIARRASIETLADGFAKHGKGSKLIISLRKQFNVIVDSIMTRT